MKAPHAPARPGGMGDDDWLSLRHELLQLFTPGAPIDEFALFAGRQDQIHTPQRHHAVDRGRHAVVFGERGVGKTSIVQHFPSGSPPSRKGIYIT